MRDELDKHAELVTFQSLQALTGGGSYELLHGNLQAELKDLKDLEDAQTISEIKNSSLDRLKPEIANKLKKDRLIAKYKEQPAQPVINNNNNNNNNEEGNNVPAQPWMQPDLFSGENLNLHVAAGFGANVRSVFLAGTIEEALPALTRILGESLAAQEIQMNANFREYNDQSVFTNVDYLKQRFSILVGLIGVEYTPEERLGGYLSLLKAMITKLTVPGQQLQQNLLQGDNNNQPQQPRQLKAGVDGVTTLRLFKLLLEDMLQGASYEQLGIVNAQPGEDEENIDINNLFE